MPWSEGGPSQVHDVQPQLIAASTAIGGVRISSVTVTAVTTSEGDIASKIHTSRINITCIKWA